MSDAPHTFESSIIPLRFLKVWLFKYQYLFRFQSTSTQMPSWMCGLARQPQSWPSCLSKKVWNIHMLKTNIKMKVLVCQVSYSTTGKLIDIALPPRMQIMCLPPSLASRDGTTSPTNTSSSNQRRLTCLSCSPRDDWTGSTSVCMATSCGTQTYRMEVWPEGGWQKTWK